MCLKWKKFGDTSYSISNTGLVRNDKTNRLLFGSLNTSGYYQVNLTVNSIVTRHSIHVLVAKVFLGFKPNGRKLVIHHIDGNKLNNYSNNLAIITFRENCSIERTAKSKSKYTGVSRGKKSKKWSAAISINGKLKFLGVFDTKEEAYNKYQEVLLTLNEKTNV